MTPSIRNILKTCIFIAASFMNTIVYFLNNKHKISFERARHMVIHSSEGIREGNKESRGGQSTKA